MGAQPALRRECGQGPACGRRRRCQEVYGGSQDSWREPKKRRGESKASGRTQQGKEPAQTDGQNHSTALLCSWEVSTGQQMLVWAAAVHDLATMLRLAGWKAHVC